MTPLYKKLKQNGTTMYVFPSVAEDKNFERQNENYKMSISHFALLNFPREVIGSKLDFENAFYQQGTSIPAADFKDRLVESLRNYVANHIVTIRNSKINSTDFYYDANEIETVDEKVFWKWAKSLGIIDFEPADNINDYFGSDSKYNDNGVIGNTDHFRELLWTERKTIIYDAVNSPTAIAIGNTTSVILGTPTIGHQYATITLTTTTTFKVGDYILINNKLPNVANINNLDVIPYSIEYSLVKIVALDQTSTFNDTIVIEIDATKNITNFVQPIDLTVQSAYTRFVQMVGEIAGINNVQNPDKAYTETFAQVSYQYGQTPYLLWNISEDNNYKPNSVFPILPSEYQGEIKGGELATNPILTNPNNYPGDIWAQFDKDTSPSFTYKTKTGNIIKRSGDYYGINAGVFNNNPNLMSYPNTDGSKIDGLKLNLDISDYTKAVSYTFPIESFLEFAGTAFNNEAPKDFEFNAVLWYYTIEDTTGNETRISTNIYGIEFLDTPENDIVQPLNKNWIPTSKKYVSNGYQDGNSYTFTLDLNYAIDSDVEPPSFDPDKVYSLFGMELFYEAMTRLTYFNDQVTNIVTLNESLKQEVNSLKSLVFTQQSFETIRSRMDNLENLLNIYSTLQIGNSSTIIPTLDTSVVPPLLRLNSVDKQYGYVYQYNTNSMFSDFINVNTFTEYSINEKTIPVVNGKDFLVIINNNDHNEPIVQYDSTVQLSNLKIVLEKDLEYKQKIDILIYPKNELITNGEAVQDKKIDLYINYDDGDTSTPNTNVLIGTYNLPVNNTLISRELEYTNKFNNVPELNVMDVKYFIPSAAEREIILIVEDDLVYSYFNTLTPEKRIIQGHRVFVDNLFINTNPASPSGANYVDMSGQYEVHVDPTYLNSHVYDVELITQGSGYDPNLNNVYIASKSIYISTDSTGKIISIKLGGFGEFNNPLYTDNSALIDIDYPAGSANSFNDITGTITSVALSDTTVLPTKATYKFKTKKITKLKLIVKDFTTNPTINTLLSTYDTVLNVTANPVREYDIKPFLKVTPTLTFLKGWKISLTRISDTTFVPVSLINTRYAINSTKL